MNSTSTNDIRDSRALMHAAQRAKNPNISKSVTMNSVNAPTSYDHMSSSREDSDVGSRRFRHTGVPKQPTTADHMSARRMVQQFMKGGN